MEMLLNAGAAILTVMLIPVVIDDLIYKLRGGPAKDKAAEDRINGEIIRNFIKEDK